MFYVDHWFYIPRFSHGATLYFSGKELYGADLIILEEMDSFLKEWSHSLTEEQVDCSEEQLAEALFYIVNDKLRETPNTPKCLCVNIEAAGSNFSYRSEEEHV